MTEWRYGDILRRAVTKNPVQYSYVMYIGPHAGKPFDYFIGLQLSEPIDTPVGKWIKSPPAGTLRKALRRELFELTVDI